jgi:hypothetical protein
MLKSGAEHTQKSGGQGRPAERATRVGRVIFKLMKPRPLRIGLACTLVVSALMAVALHVSPTRAEHHVAQAKPIWCQ